MAGRAAGCHAAQETVEELETHLRSCVSELQRAGLSDEESLLIAQRRLGEKRLLKSEFEKVNGGKQALGASTRSLILAAFFIPALLFFLDRVLPTAELDFFARISVAEMIANLLRGVKSAPAHALFALALAGLGLIPAYVYARLRDGRHRLIVGLVCLAMPLLLFRKFEAAEWVGAVAMSPVWTASALLGHADGEFFKDHLMAPMSASWWVLLWLALVSYETLLEMRRLTTLMLGRMVRRVRKECELGTPSA